MQDLSKIDFSKCESRLWSERLANGDLRSIRIRPVWDAPHRNPVLKLGEPGSSVAALTGHGWQLLEGAVLMTVREVEFVLRYMKQVDAFMDEELNRMAEEAVPKAEPVAPLTDIELQNVKTMAIGQLACIENDIKRGKVLNAIGRTTELQRGLLVLVKHGKGEP